MQSVGIRNKAWCPVFIVQMYRKKSWGGNCLFSSSENVLYCFQLMLKLTVSQHMKATQTKSRGTIEGQDKINPQCPRLPLSSISAPLSHKSPTGRVRSWHRQHKWYFTRCALKSGKCSITLPIIKISNVKCLWGMKHKSSKQTYPLKSELRAPKMEQPSPLWTLFKQNTVSRLTLNTYTRVWGFKSWLKLTSLTEQEKVGE